MKGKLTGRTEERITFNYKTNETKYYLLTEGSGYPLAEFAFSGLTKCEGTKLVVPEHMPKTADVVPPFEE